MRIFSLLILLSVVVFANSLKTPSDVYSYAVILKKKIEYLRVHNGIDTPFPKVAKQYNKYPRHVIQKSLEILSKIDLYRVSKGYGEIFIPTYPARDVTPSDVYDSVKRLDEEVTPFIKDDKFLDSITIQKFHNKTPNDVYQLLWSISLAFDSLLGIHGYTPTDVFELSQKVVKIVKFLKESQNDFKQVNKPQKIEDQYPNHALYTSYKLLDRIAIAEKKLWMQPTEVPEKTHKVVTPTDVYDSIQYIIAELQRIKYRLGLERYFKQEHSKEVKTPSDVVQNLRYATALMPEFSLKKQLVQYHSTTLKKTPNDVYGVTQEILEKLNTLKGIRGISKQAKKPPYIYGLEPIHAYQKGIEAIEKAMRLKEQSGFFPSQVPNSPIRKITPSEVYELVLRLDGIVTLLLKKFGDKNVENYVYKLNKPVYINKTPSDVYNNLWKISNQIDVILAKEYTPNETYMLSEKLQAKVKLILKKLSIKQNILQEKIEENKTPHDVFVLSIRFFDLLKQMQDRLNVGNSNIIIPNEKNVTPNTVYNTLRIINAALNEILIDLDIETEELLKNCKLETNKTPTDVYVKMMQTFQMVELLFRDKNYEK